MLTPADDHLLAERLRRQAKAAGKAQARWERALGKAAGRHARRVARARRRLPVQAAVGLGAGLATIPADEPVWFGAVSIVALLAGVRSLGHLLSPPPAARPALPVAAVPPPPPVHSAAFPAVRRLEAVREELRRLLPLVAPSGRDTAEEAWQAAGEADTALRWQAARLAAVEPHRGVEPELLRGLEDGVACQERLVGAVADLVAASADPLAAGRLQDVEDRLRGLASGLREVR